MSTSEVQPITVLPPPEFSEHEKWMEQRRLGIGGSEVHHMFPCLNLEDKDDPGSRYGCPRRLSYEKLDVKPDCEYTPGQLRIFERGHILEEHAAQKFTDSTGRRVFRSNKPWVSPAYPFMRCNIDRRIKSDERGVGCLECKSANEHIFFRMQKEGLPPAYGLQLQHNIACMDVEWGAFAVIESPDYLDAVIEQMSEGRLRRRIIETVADKFDFVSFEVKRDEAIVGMIVEKERQFWSLVEERKLADPLPVINDDRCKSCSYRRTCRGAAFAEANAKIPQRDKKTGIEYATITNETFVDAVADRLHLMKEIAERAELLAAIDNELKQNFPPDVAAVKIPGVDVSIRWNWQRGQSRWDAEALKADGESIGRKVAFADWAQKRSPELVAEFVQSGIACEPLEKKYKAQGAPTRPFVFSVKGSE